MKRLLFALLALAFVVSAAPKAEARVDVSIDFFYNNLTDGHWMEVEDYGYCWQPSIAVSNPDWRPYTDGYWAYTDVGWTWVSYEDFGWATYHYGRWARVRGHGWLWVPGREWGPAWVSWRTGGDYVGWAPLPPRRRYAGAREVVYEGRPIYGQVDIEFDIGPAYYNFVDIRYIGAPVLREHIYAPTQNVTYISRTVNVTNITYTNSVVHNYGPDYERLNAYSTRPIQRLTLQRNTDVDLQAAVKSGSLTKVQGNQLIVAAPASIEVPAQPAAPKNIKTRIADPDLETGWTGIESPTAKAELQEKMKKEDPKSVPPPQVAPQNPAALQAGSTPPAPAGSPATTPASPDASPAAAASPATPAIAEPGRGKGRDKRAPEPPDASASPAAPASPDASPATAVSPATSATAAPERGKGRNKRTPEPAAEATPALKPGATRPTDDPAPAAPDADPKRGSKDKRNRDAGQSTESEPLRDMKPAPTAPAPVPRKDPNKGNRTLETDPFTTESERPQSGNPAVESAPPAAAPERERGPKNRDRRGGGAEIPPVQQPSQIVAPPADEPRAGTESRGRGKQKKEETRMAPPVQAQPQEQPRERPVAAPPQIAPAPMAPAVAPAGPPPGAAPEHGRGKPDKGDKNKDEEKGEKPPKENR
jgi:hypothetical protein